MTWLVRTKEALSSRKAFVKAIETKEVDGEQAAYNEDLLPTEPGMIQSRMFHLHEVDLYDRATILEMGSLFHLLPDHVLFAYQL